MWPKKKPDKYQLDLEEALVKEYTKPSKTPTGKRVKYGNCLYCDEVVIFGGNCDHRMDGKKYKAAHKSCCMKANKGNGSL